MGEEMLGHDASLPRNARPTNQRTAQFGAADPVDDWQRPAVL